jgi:nitrate reductase delta subunit
MLGFIKKSPGHGLALDRIKEWTRARFKLSDDTTILVSEVACRLPGCPPLETVVVFWTQNDKRHHFKIFKPVAEVVLEDLPPSWMKNALADQEGFGCECC